MKIKLFASIDLLNQECVQLVRGNPSEVRIREKDPLAVAEKWEKEGYDGLHLVDLDGSLKGRRVNKNVLEKIVKNARIPCEVGGGLRSERDVREVVDWGAKAVIGTKALDSDFREKIYSQIGPENLVLALDAKKDKIVVKGWRSGTGKSVYDVAKEIDKDGLAAIFYTNVAIEGTLGGLDFSPIEKLASSLKTPLIVAGGIRDYEDLEKLDELGVYACALGMAIYTGKIKKR